MATAVQIVSGGTGGGASYEKSEKLHKNLSLISGMLIMLLLGSSYSISAWNSELKSLLNLTHSEITFLSSMASFGMFMSPPPGAIYDKFGVKFALGCFTISFSTCYGFVSWSVLHPAVQQFLRALTFFFVGQAGGLAVSSTLGSIEGLYGPESRGKMIGILMSSFSAGGVLYTFIFHSFFQHNLQSYFLFLSMNAIVVGVLGLFHIQPSVQRSGIREEMQLLDSYTKGTTGIKLFQNREFWYLFFSVLSSVGSALFVMNNIAFIVESRDGVVRDIPYYVALFSICNMQSRFLIGLLSDYCLKRYSRGWFLSSAIFLQAFAQLMFLTISPRRLWIPIAMAGVAEGGVFTTFPVLVCELFGQKHYGKNYGYVSLANAVGYSIIIQPLSTAIYNWNIRSSSSTLTEKCIGNSCFDLVFIFCGIICLLSLYGSTKFH